MRKAIRFMIRLPSIPQCLASLALATAIALGVGCSEEKPETPDVIVLQSGRMRGNVYPKSLQSIAPLQHYPYLAGYVAKVRQEAAASGAKVLLVDLGDSLGGSFASHATKSRNMVDFFNEVGYDAIVLGNLDNNVSPEALADLKPVVLSPFAAPDGSSAVTGTTFGTQLDLGGVPVELLANFYGDTSRQEFPERFPTWFANTDDEVSPVRDYAAVIESLAPRPPGALTLLTWMKFESPKNPPTAFLKTLADLRVDAILAHRIYSSGERDVWSESTLYDWTPPVSENILRNNGGFTLARLDLKRDGDNWRILRQELLPMTANTAAADNSIVERISDYAGEISKADRTLDELRDPVPEDQILRGYLAALSQIPGTQVAAYSRQSVRSNWPAGTLNSSRVFNSLPWTTAVVQLTLTPDQLGALGELSGMVFLKKANLPADSPVIVTTSRFFASLITDQLGLPASNIQTTAAPSEFDAFIDYLAAAPKPLTFALPEGWTFVDPRG